MWLGVTPLPVWVPLRSSLIRETKLLWLYQWLELISDINIPDERAPYVPDNISPLKHQRAVCFVSFQFPWSDENSHTVQVSPSSVPALWTPVSLIHSKMNPFWKYISWNHISMSSCSGYLWHSLRWTLSRDWLSTKFRLFRDYISESESLIIRSSWSSE